MKNICEKCGGSGVVYVDALESRKEVQPQRTTLSMTVTALENEWTKLQSLFAKAITKVFGILRR